jgi:hypothetical protein
MFISPPFQFRSTYLTYKIASYEVGVGRMFQENPGSEGGLGFRKKEKPWLAYI